MLDTGGAEDRHVGRVVVVSVGIKEYGDPALCRGFGNGSALVAAHAGTVARRGNFKLAHYLALALTANAVAASVPAWAWWTDGQAGKNVIRANPQRIDAKGDPTTVTDAKCTGRAAAKNGRYRAFTCLVHFRDDRYGVNSGVTLYVTTSTAKRNAVACWATSPVALARGECRPPKIG